MKALTLTMKTHCLQHKDVVIAWVRIILALGTNHLNFGYESSGYETSVGTKRPVSIRSNSELFTRGFEMNSLTGMNVGR